MASRSDDLGETLPDPRESGVTPEQTEATTGAALAQFTPETRGGIGQSEIAAAVREATTGFRSGAFQGMLARWTDDLHRRLDECQRRSDALADRLRQEETTRARLEERIDGLQKKSLSEDVLKLLGGAFLAVGITELVSGHWGIGLAALAAGLVLAHIGGALLSRLWK
jgi:hypothetical protein